MIRRIERTPTGRILLAEVRHQNKKLQAEVKAVLDRTFIHRASRDDLDRLMGLELL